MARTMLVVFALSLASTLVACGGDAPAPAPRAATSEPPPATSAPPAATSLPPAATSVPPAATSVPPAETLDVLATRFQTARAAGNDAMATSLAWSLVPTKADLAAIVAKSPSAEAFLAAFKFVDLPATHDDVRTLGRQLFAPGDPKRTETKVHAATTEQLVAYAAGSVAFDEFPGNMRRFAAIAAPGRTFYVVEHVEPGSDTGMKYTCFTRIGDRWIFLPKPWGAVPD